MYHILNGDSLGDRFPDDIHGEILIMRECLVDGDVSGSTHEEFFINRATFLSQMYNTINYEDYFNETVPELTKISTLSPDTEINLWFEDDLFCQVNLWYILFQLQDNKSLYLIRPPELTPFGFAALDKGGLHRAYDARIKLSDSTHLAELWPAYREKQWNKLEKIGNELSSEYPYLLPAIKANNERYPENGGPGRPEQSLKNIMEELGTDKFGPVFREFNKRECIYGFGDLQVHRIFDQIKSH